MQQSAGEVRNRHVQCYLDRGSRIQSLSKCSARSSLGATTSDWLKEATQKKQQGSMKTTNQRFAWPRTINFTGAQNTLESSTISSGNRWRMEMWSWATAVQKKWLRICLLKAWVVNSSGNYERCLDWMRCRLVPPASEKECWGRNTCNRADTFTLSTLLWLFVHVKDPTRIWRNVF